MTSRADLARRCIGMLDLTELADHATDADAVALCRRSITVHGTVAAVCVWPRHVEIAAAELAGSGVRIATVVNFPSGDEAVPHVVDETERALDGGADEIDLVVPFHALLGGAPEHVVLMLESVRATVSVGSGLLKVILETSELGGVDHIRGAARLAIDHGADFVKTSTGKASHGATPEATAAMLAEIAATPWPVGLKPSGGIRRLDDALAFLSQAEEVMGVGWATPSTFRLGASALLDDLLVEVASGAGPSA